MVVILRNNTEEKKKEQLIHWLRKQGVEVHTSVGQYQTILGLVGDTSRIDAELVASLEHVEAVHRVSAPYMYGNRKFHPDDTEISFGEGSIGGGHFAMMAGPGSVESEELLLETAHAVKAAGASLLRCVIKKSYSPYSQNGESIHVGRLVDRVHRETGLAVVGEIDSLMHLDEFEAFDVLQVSARNMQNYELLRALGKQERPIILKRGHSASLQEHLVSAEHILTGGNGKVILCERGMRCFDEQNRCTLDLAGAVLLREMSHLPVMIDVSQTGFSRTVEPMALSAAACGADGICVEVHPDPMSAHFDAAQSIRPEAFAALCRKVEKIREVIA